MSREASYSLSRIGNAKAALSQAKNLSDVLEIRDKAEAIRVYIKAAGEGLEVQNQAAEIKLRAERKAGELLAGMEKHNGDPRLHDATRLEELGINKTQSSRWQREASVPDEAFEKHIAECHEKGFELTQSGLLKLAGAGHVAQATGENEWYTPPKFVERAREAMGGIDLDPASCEVAQSNVKAKKFYSIDDDGLSKKWNGRVWMNPPYSKDLCSRFIGALLESYSEGRVTQAVVLVNNATETAWMQTILGVCSAVCFPMGRIRFLDGSGKPANSPLQGQCFVYLGDDVASFVNEFEDIGVCLVSSNG